jgi:hypothetical protein
VEGAGTIARDSAGPQTASGSSRSRATTTWAFAWPEVRTEPETEPSSAGGAGGKAKPAQDRACGEENQQGHQARHSFWAMGAQLDNAMVRSKLKLWLHALADRTS